MSEIRTYACDVCKKGRQMEDLYTLALAVTGPLRPGIGQYRRSLCNNKHICVVCINKMEIVLPEPPNPNMDDRLLDILRDFILDTVEDN